MSTTESKEFKYPEPVHKQQEFDLFGTILAQKHVLIAGTPGAGKSVLLNSLVYQIIQRPPLNIPGGAFLVLLDQKGNELIDFADAPHACCHAVEPAKVVTALKNTVELMEARFQEMMIQHQKLYPKSDIYVIIDEWADLMVSSRKQVMPLIQRLAQKGRAAKIHVILSTQCLLTRIVPTEIKCCFDSIVALRTATQKDSRYIIGINDCYNLPDYGSCFVSCPQFREPKRYDGIPFTAEADIAETIQYWTDVKDRKFIDIYPKIEQVLETVKESLL